jgi:hypothetical protein
MNRDEAEQENLTCVGMCPHLVLACLNIGIFYVSHIDLPTIIVLGIDLNDNRNLHFAKHIEENMQYF